MNPVSTLKERLSRRGIEIELSANYPWIYLQSVNGNRIQKEDWTANYGFNVAWFPVKPGEEIVLAESPQRIIALIRKYK